MQPAICRLESYTCRYICRAFLKVRPDAANVCLSRWLKAVREATADLPQEVEVTYWKGSLFENEPYVDNFRDFRQLRGAPVLPLEAPKALRGLPKGLESGQLPSAEELQQRLTEADSVVLHHEVFHFDGVKLTYMPDMKGSVMGRSPLEAC